MAVTPAVGGPDHAARRRALVEAVGAPILLANNGTRARNLPINALPFRADSTFLYYTGCTEPGAFVLLADGHTTLFLAPPEPGDELWHGHVASLEDRRIALGADVVRPLAALDAVCAPHRERLVSLAVPDASVNVRLSVLLGRALAYPGSPGADVLIDAIIRQRRTHDAWELAQMREAAALTTDAHLAAMGATRPGATEREVAALFDAVIAARGGTLAYRSIVTVRGEVLHNPDYPNRLGADDMLLLDGGAEVASGDASDVTRAWPVRGQFDSRQRDVYDIVLRAQARGIVGCRPGARYRDLHFAATRVLAEGLRDLGLLRGDLDGLVESGATGVFFPHGLGHLIGLDVHDLENFGDRPAYPPGRARPAQFGARYLRMDLDLTPGLVVTVEPGIHMVPAILHDRALRTEFAAQVDFDAAERWVGFGGVRIEDDVHVRDDAGGEPEVLTAAIPRDIAAIEARLGRGPSARERLSA